MSNRGGGRRSGPDHPTKNVGLAKSRLLERLVGVEVSDKYDYIVGDKAYHESKGGLTRQGRVSPLH